ncbi:MAG: type II secretion system F family protein [Candidatus Omnitrophota bacterium]
MPFYTYKAKSGPDKVVSGEIEAASQDAAVEKLGEKGLTPVSVTEAYAAEPFGGHPARSHPTPSDAGRHLAGWPRSGDIDIFTRQIASLIKAGVPVLRALSIIVSQTESKPLKAVVDDLSTQIRDGRMLSESMSKYPRIFNGLYISMIKAGEKGGALDEVLYRLADYREKEDELRRKIQAAAAYPVFVMVVGIISVFVMLTFFLPKLMGIFSDMSQLPLPTRMLKQASDFMSANWVWFIIGSIFVIAVFFRSKPGGKRKMFFDAVKLNIPFVRRFVRNVEIARFSRTLGLLFKNGISVHESLQLATDTLDNGLLRAQLGTARDELLNKGQTLSASLKKINMFPVFAVNMIAVGEEGGKLEESLAEIANVYEKEVEQSIKIMTALLEPVLILAVGAVVGFIVFAMLLPIFSIGLGAK